MKQTQINPDLDEAGRAAAAEVAHNAARAARATKDAASWMRNVATRIAALNLRNALARLSTAEMNARLWLLIGLAAVVTAFDSTQLASFAVAIADLSPMLREHPEVLAGLMSVSLTTCDVVVGQAWAGGQLSSARRAVLVFMLLLVPSVITTATALARWAAIGPMAIETILVTIGLVLFTIVVHAALIGLASTGVASWALYRFRHYRLQSEARRAQHEYDRCVSELDRTRIDAQLALPDHLFQRIRPMLEAETPDEAPEQRSEPAAAQNTNAEVHWGE